jgi:hypothetical protein
MVTSLRRLELHKAGLHSKLLKTIKQASVANQQCERIDRLYNTVSVLVCLSKQKKNRQLF